MREMAIFDVAHSEARRLVAGGAPVYLTINPVEYHGPHLSLHNDRLVSIGLIRDLHARVGGDAPLLLGSDLEIGVEPCPGTGSRHTPFPLARELVREACRALVELGCQRVVLMTFHGSPLHNVAIEAGIEVLVEGGVRAVAPFNYLLRELLTLEPARYAEAFAHVEDAAERDAMIRDMRSDFHAGFFETSMALHYAPSSVAACYRDLPPCPDIVPEAALDMAARLARKLGRVELAAELDFAAVGKGWNAMRPFYGYTGRPHRASAAAGAVFASAMLERFERGARAVFDGRERSPRPIMTWIETVSLRGRLGGMDVPIDQIYRYQDPS
jgi:creatinine amidohydrolase